jgi:hypothetical protein
VDFKEFWQCYNCCNYEVLKSCGSIYVVCEYNGSVVDVDEVLKRMWKCNSVL